MARALLVRASDQTSVITRKQVAGVARQAIVGEYRDVSPAMLAGATCVICFVGATKGGAAYLEEVNAALPAMLASAARTAAARRFIYISSFSVYGDCSQIGPDTPPNPISDYGHSKWQGEQRLAALRQDDFESISLRLPSLYDADQGKLAQLVHSWTRLRLFPVPPHPIRRSFMSYDNAAALLVNGMRTAFETMPTGPLIAADPEPFLYEKASNEIRRATGRSVHGLRVPLADSLARTIAPALHASLFRDCFLQPHANAAKDMASTLYQDIAAMARQGARLQ